ncbi:hypothetical protein NST11_01125 [Caldifermentibacillus hisashii]
MTNWMFAHPSPYLIMSEMFKNFFEWLIAEKIVDCESLRSFPVQALEILSLADANNYFKFLGRKKYRVSKKEDEIKQIDVKTVNRHKSSLRSLSMFCVSAQ